VFTRVRTEALSGKSKRTVWHEWSCEGDVDLDDQTQWHKANPALGVRLLFEVVEGERANLSDDGFARERLGMWAGSLSTSVIDAESWNTVKDESSKAVDRFALAVTSTPTARSPRSRSPVNARMALGMSSSTSSATASGGWSVTSPRGVQVVAEAARGRADVGAARLGDPRALGCAVPT
jgi:hypothetical protein